jgi:hypothetical protein
MGDMRKFVLLLLAAAIATTSTGCLSRPKAGVQIVKSPLDSTATPCTVTVPHSGRYELRREGGTENQIPTAVVEIGGDDQLGFKRQADGTVVAQAGPAEFPLAEGTYYWTIAKESELTGPRLRWYYAKRAGKGVLIAGGVVVVAGLVVVGTLGAIFLVGFKHTSFGHNSFVGLY